MQHQQHKSTTAQKLGLTGMALILLGVIVLIIIGGAMIGYASINPSLIVRSLLHNMFGIGEIADDEQVLDYLIWNVRMPRTIMAITIGIALSVSGVVMQSIIKNPLANPYTLGISSGASLGATVAIMLGFAASLGTNSIGIFAFAGAFGVALLVIRLSNTGGKSNSIRLLLSGMAISALCGSISSFIVYTAADAEGMLSITFWLMGSVGRSSWSQITFLLPVILLVSAFFVTQYRTLNLMLLGDDAALTLGRDLHRFRIAYLLLTAFLVGLSVFAAGMIGFVGLIIPHIVRSFTGTDHKKLLLFSALAGGIYLGSADIISRVILPSQELPIGIITSMVGGPFFIYMLIKKSYNFGAK